MCAGKWFDDVRGQRSVWSGRMETTIAQKTDGYNLGLQTPANSQHLQFKGCIYVYVCVYTFLLTRSSQGIPKTWVYQA